VGAPADIGASTRRSVTPGYSAITERQRVQSDQVIQGKDRWAYRALVSLWVTANLVFWSIWLRGENVGSLWLFAVFTLALAYETTFLPSMYAFYVGRMRRPRPLDAPPGLKVAMITLCVPSTETIDVIVKQLEALGRVRYPHDSWILDEGNDPAVREAAERLGVRYFSRKGVERYNQPVPPFKAKTKAGNVNAWLDAWGADYDFFVQLDIDHRPNPGYLDRVLGYFADPRVAWVQAPSLYKNLDNWFARGAAEQELVLQGPLQQGFYGASETPFIIGSHATYRMAAVQEIGGFQPTRAEDHLDTVVLATHGYRGVFVPEEIAAGGGPDTFETYLSQQFAWAYSMIQVLFSFAPRYLRGCPPVQALQFLFAQTWYPVWATSMLVLFLTPAVVLLTGARPSTISLSTFALAYLPVNLVSFAFYLWSRKWHLPAGLTLSWRGIILHVARWPIIFWALINVILRVTHPYMVTPKGKGYHLSQFSLASQAPYLGLGLFSVSATWLYLLRGDCTECRGYVGFAILGAFWMLVVVATNLLVATVNQVRSGVSLPRAARLRFAPILTVVVAVFVLQGTVFAGYPSLLRSPEHAAVASQAYTVIPESIVPAPIPDVRRDASPDRSVLPMDLPLTGVAFGAYDPSRELTNATLDFDHWYVRDDRPADFRSALLASSNRRSALVTIEPAPSEDSRTAVLQEVVDGRRDGELRRLAAVARDSQPQVVFVRWAQEMDLDLLYPWSIGDPEGYRAAFRHVVAIFRAEGAANVRWVWSPSGNVGSLDYYPGDDVVDYVGLTILGDARWDESFGHAPQSFSELLRDRYSVVKVIGKPIFIAELGVSGIATRQSAWLADASKSLSEFPLVRAVIYFDARNASNNFQLIQPDWRVAPDTLQQFATTMISANLAAPPAASPGSRQSPAAGPGTLVLN
jgi:cellulose synthase (UDP-forming)